MPKEVTAKKARAAPAGLAKGSKKGSRDKAGSRKASAKGSSSNKGSGSKRDKKKKGKHGESLEAAVLEDRMGGGAFKPAKGSRKGESKRAPKAAAAVDEDEGAVEEGSDHSDDEGVVPDRLSKKILQAVHSQAKEEQEAASEEAAAERSGRSPAVARVWERMRAKGDDQKPVELKSAVSDSKRAADDDDDDEDDLRAGDEEEVEEVEISAADEAALELFNKPTPTARRTLGDMIMEKIREKETQGPRMGTATSAMGPPAKRGETKERARRGSIVSVMDEMQIDSLPEELVACYREVGTYMAKYTSGKIPKPFKVIPNLANWEQILQLTDPDKWTAQATFVATRLFASNLKEKMAQRFFNLVLLPRVRTDIEDNKRLNFHLYNAVRKTIYKPAAFFKGILLPMAEYGCSAREAVIMCSILGKCSIPVLHSGAAIVRLCKLPYAGPTTLFIKTLVNKKYSLPYKVVDALVSQFVRHDKARGETRDMPVVWHQSLLTFIQRYKNDLQPLQKEKLKTLLRSQVHKGMTEEIRRELIAPPPLSASSSSASPSPAFGPSSSSSQFLSAPWVPPSFAAL